MSALSSLRDHVNLTRATELQKGGWASLSSPLPDYPLYSALLPRLVKKSSDTYSFTISTDEVGKTTNLTGFFVGVGSTIQPAQHAATRRATVALAKAREVTTISEDQRELQGSDDTQLADQIALIKAEQLDLPLLAKQEFTMARSPGGSETETEVFGLPYWFPHDAAATDIELYGGDDPTGYAGGAAGVTVAQVPRWAHAVGGFNAVSDADLFDKLQTFLIRVNAYVPEGVKAIDSGAPDRCGLMQHPVAVNWSRVQKLSNDNPGRDLGMWRDAIWYSSIPFKTWHAISEPDSPTCPSGYGLIYLLDLSTLQLVFHSTYGGMFNLQTREPQDQPGVIWLFREGYYQLICKRRNRNLVLYTANPDLISLA